MHSANCQVSHVHYVIDETCQCQVVNTMVKQCLGLFGSSFPAVAISPIFKMCGQAAFDSQKFISQLCHTLIPLTFNTSNYNGLCR
jgi:hypothetical protein